VRYALLRGIEELEGAVSESTATTSD
jgi:hypothetical protein